MKSFIILSSNTTMIADQESQRKCVYAVGAGSRVTYSSCYTINHANYLLDYQVNGLPHCWASKTLSKSQWIQVSCENPKRWTDIILQGRTDYPQWVKSFKVSYTLNGKQWEFVENGKVFQGNADQITKVRTKFEHPITARAIRIHPVQWNGHISLRFDALYIDE